ncbi:MAG TPA: hypothetical protein P5076_06900 [Myxococcota bacterium]|nr:hypothetical protein [Myxococcota bacterium]
MRWARGGGMLGAACLAWLALAPARAGDFMDVRLTWLLGDGNLLASPEEGSAGLGPSDGARSFFDNYDTKYTGFETLGHLVLYKSVPAFFEGFGAEAALFLGIQTSEPYLRDEGSYIRMTWDWTHGLEPGTNLELTFFPVDADRFRLGYSYKVSWGGTQAFAFREGDTQLAPGLRLQVNLPWGHAFVGLKATRLTEDFSDGIRHWTAPEVNYAGLAGLGMDHEGFVAEVRGGYFEGGEFEGPGAEGEAHHLAGLSYQLGYHQGVPIGTSIDFELYRNDPYLEERFFAPEEYDGGLSFVVKHEGSVIFQNLGDPGHFGQQVEQIGWAFDLNAALKLGFLRVHLDVVARSLEFLLHEEPGFTPFQGIPDQASVSPEVWAAVGLDYFFEGPRLTPGLTLGVKKPATSAIADLDVGGVTLRGHRVVVIYGPDEREILPADQDEGLVWTVKTSLRWDYAEILALVAELYYSRDPNRVRYLTDFNGLNLYSTFLDEDVLGLNLMAQARF